MTIGTMEKTYDDLAAKLHKHLQKEDHQHWIAIGGGPGSGKSTTADAIAERLNNVQENSCVVIPMDGFHYSKEKLKEIDPPDGVEYLKRRGAPWTYNTAWCMELLTKARTEKCGSFPIYDRSISDPVPNGTKITLGNKVVLIEGLYVLWKDDDRWGPMDALWDERWFVKAPSLEAQRQRLIDRSLKTWTKQKSEMWGPGEKGAAARVDANDDKNMKIVAPCEDYADTIIETK